MQNGAALKHLPVCKLIQICEFVHPVLKCVPSLGRGAVVAQRTLDPLTEVRTFPPQHLVQSAEGSVQ